MPSVSKSEARTMRAAKHDPEFRQKMGISPRVAKDFVAADKARGKAALRRLPEKVKKR